MLKSNLLSASHTASWDELLSYPKEEPFLLNKGSGASRALDGLLRHTLALRGKHREKLHFNTRTFFCTWPLSPCSELKIGVWGGNKRKDAHSRKASCTPGGVHEEAPPSLPLGLISDPGSLGSLWSSS